jgi:hypothetical protein
MNQDITKDLQDTQKMCQFLMQTPHYKKIGCDGIYAIVEKAKAVGVNPMEALNGGFYFVQGKVEMTSAMMNQLIRSKKHSITKDKKSDDTICILHGKRADNGDTWVESFSIDDAKKAGIYRNQWLRYPKDMLFARALSRLARQLFPDTICGMYVQGEISEAPIIEEAPRVFTSEEQANKLDAIIGDDHKYRECVMSFIKKQFDLDSLVGIPKETYDKILPVALKKQAESKQKSIKNIYGEQQQIAVGE